MEPPTIKKKICRDYLQGTCTKGSKCKFLHPEILQDIETQQPIQPPTEPIEQPIEPPIQPPTESIQQPNKKLTVGTMVRSVTNLFQSDTCDGDPICNLCDLLQALTPDFFQSASPVNLKPVFKKLNESINDVYWDNQIKESIGNFEMKMRDNLITSIHEIPLVLYVNLSSGGLEIISHSHIMFIIPNEDGTKSAYTMGLGQNKETKKIIIRSPDFNPYVKINNEESINKSFSCSPYNHKKKIFEGKYIIKAIEPLTIQYLKNFRNFLHNKIVDVNFIEIGKNDFRRKREKEKIWVIQTKIPYVMFNLTHGENCASFAEKLSYKQNINDISVSNKICGINNPSSSVARYSNVTELNTFISNVIQGNETDSVEWLLNLYDIFNSPEDDDEYEPLHLGGKKIKKRNKSMRNKSMKKIKKNKSMRKIKNKTRRKTRRKY